jgi:uncharacterized protein
MRILLYLTIGLTIGTISGAFGIGGGVLLVPALVWLCDLKPQEAAGTSLAILIPPIGLPAAWKYYQHGHVNLGIVFWIAVAFAGGAYLGASLVTGNYIPERTLRLGFGLMMMYVALRFIVGSSSEVANAAAGLTATAAAWLYYLVLRALGRRHLVRPDLGTQIRSMQQQGRGESDYYI